MTLDELNLKVTAMDLRLTLMEEVVTDLQTAVTKLASLEQLRRINLIRQTELDDLQTQINELRNTIALLKGQIKGLEASR